jgi:hypothetical protein
MLVVLIYHQELKVELSSTMRKQMFLSHFLNSFYPVSKKFGI